MAWTVVGNIRGPEGPQGPQGDTGDQGPEGPQGAPGVDGAAGPAGLTWRGAWSNATAYAISDSVGWGGSTYFATAAHAANANEPPTGTTADPGANDAAVNTGWQVLSLQGATGATGAQGPQGIQGTAGATGAQGVKGDTGDQGPQGLTGSQGPQGIQGVQGLTGAQGTRGTAWFTGNGAPGTISGSLPGDQYLDLISGTVYTLS